MSELALLSDEDLDQPGFAPEPGDVDTSGDLGIADGVDGLEGGDTIADAFGDEEFGVDQADVEQEVMPARTRVDDSDLLGDADAVPQVGCVVSPEPAGGGDAAASAESAQLTATDVVTEAEPVSASSDPANGDDAIPAEARVADHVVADGDTAQDEYAVEDAADGDETAAHHDQEASADDADPAGETTPTRVVSAPVAQFIGRTASGADDRAIILAPEPMAAADYQGSPERSVATVDRPHVGQRYEETDHLRGATSGERARLSQLERLPHTGFSRSEIRQVRAQIAALGYPVDNFKQFNHKRNERGTEDTIASWLGHGHGEFTVYDLYDRQIPEKRLGTLSHETAHANSPLKPENQAVYGQSQAEAAQFIQRVADQSLRTGVHLNGYHKYLLNEYRANMKELAEAYDKREITDEEMSAAQAEVNRKLQEETWAIMNEMALTNRAGLADVEARQFKALDKIAAQPGAENIPARVALISDAPTEERPDPATHGIDKWLIHLLDGVNDQKELVQHVATLKQRFYGEANNGKAQQRVQRRYAMAA